MPGDETPPSLGRAARLMVQDASRHMAEADYMAGMHAPDVAAGLVAKAQAKALLALAAVLVDHLTDDPEEGGRP